MIPLRSFVCFRKFFSQNIRRNMSSLVSENCNIHMEKKSKNYIAWIDMEMTGLNIEKDKIMELACFITDENLNTINSGLHLVIHQSPEVLAQMGDWCKINHEKSGLISACEKSIISVEEAENILLRYLEKDLGKGQCPLAGNSVYMDRLFLYKYMPRVNDFLHYRIIDVSSIKELTRRWMPEVFAKSPQKDLEHRALEDIKESILELAYYRKHVFNNNTQ